MVGRRPLIQVVVPLNTLMGGAAPAELVGHGPIPADLARALAAGGVWQRLVTDPLSGTLLDVGRTRYRPPVAMADHVRARTAPVAVPRAAAGSATSTTTGPGRPGTGRPARRTCSGSAGPTTR